VALNRPLITILDQVSQNRGYGHQLSSEIHRLLENQLFSMADMLLDAYSSVEALKHNSSCGSITGVNLNSLHQSGFCLANEPFFRAMLLAVHRFDLSELLEKQFTPNNFENVTNRYTIKQVQNRGAFRSGSHHVWCAG